MVPPGSVGTTVLMYQGATQAKGPEDETASNTRAAPGVGMSTTSSLRLASHSLNLGFGAWPGRTMPPNVQQYKQVGPAWKGAGR